MKNEDAILHELEDIKLQLTVQTQTYTTLIQKLVEAIKLLKEVVPQKKEGLPEPEYALPMYRRQFYTTNFDSIPEPCRGCPSHPNNGGSGICLCTLGCPEIT